MGREVMILAEERIWAGRSGCDGATHPTETRYQARLAVERQGLMLEEPLSVDGSRWSEPRGYGNLRQWCSDHRDSFWLPIHLARTRTETEMGKEASLLSGLCPALCRCQDDMREMMELCSRLLRYAYPKRKPSSDRANEQYAPGTCVWRRQVTDRNG